MSRKIITLLVQDSILTWRNGLVLVTLITFSAMTGLYWLLPFLLPEGVLLSSGQVFLDNTEGKIITSYMAANNADDKKIVVSRAELEKRVNHGQGTIGIIVTGNREKQEYTLVFKNKPGDKTVNILKAVMRKVASDITGEGFGPRYRIKTLRPVTPPLSSNKKMIVILLTFEVIILGFLFISVIVFNEKKEGSIRAYRVSPPGSDRAFHRHHDRVCVVYHPPGIRY